MRKSLSSIFFVLGTLFLAPALVSAQSNSNIAGVVKDATGAVLPGVTVEAASPALIEKVRSAVNATARPIHCFRVIRESWSRPRSAIPFR